MRPSGTECMDEEELAELVTRDALVGVSVPRSPSSTSLR
jgi:Nitrile hydratase, alpha chain